MRCQVTRVHQRQHAVNRGRAIGYKRIIDGDSQEALKLSEDGFMAKHHREVDEMGVGVVEYPNLD